MNELAKKLWNQYIGNNTLEGFDAFNYPIKFNEYGTKSRYAWTIDHVWPLSPNGNDYYYGSENLQNLQILSRKANNKKGNNVTGKINGIIFAVKKIDTDTNKNNIGRMKLQTSKQKWVWAYNHWEE